MDAVLTSTKPLSPVLLQHGNNHIIDTSSSTSQIAIIADTKKYMLQNANQYVKTPTDFQLNNSGRMISHKPASTSYYHDLTDGKFLSDQELLEQINFQLENSDTISSQEHAGSSYSHDVTGGKFLSDQELLKPLFTSSPSQTIQHQDALLEVKFEKRPISNVAPEAGREGSSIDCLPSADTQTLRHADNTLNIKSRCPTLLGAMLKESIHERSVTENIIKWHLPASPADRHQGQTDKSSVLDHTYCKPAKRHKK